MKNVKLEPIVNRIPYRFSLKSEELFFRFWFYFIFLPSFHFPTNGTFSWNTSVLSTYFIIVFEVFSIFVEIFV